MADLTLKFHRRETFLRYGKHKHSHEPIIEWKMRTMHDHVCTKALPIMAALALVAFLVTLPVMDYAPAYRTYHTDLISVSLPCCLAALFIGVMLHKFYYLHNVVILSFVAKLPLRGVNL